MSTKRSHDETVSLETLRAILKEEVTKPLRDELSQVASTAQASYANSAKALEELSSLTERTVTLEAGLSKMEERIKQCEMNKPRDSLQLPTHHGPSSTSTVSSCANLACLFGGFPTDTKKRDIENHVEKLMKDLAVDTQVDRFYAPGVRASICRVDVMPSANNTSREVAYGIMKKLNESPSFFKGRKLWFTINKTPKEREVASFVARTMRMLAALKIDAESVDGDFRRGIVWAKDTQMSHQFPLVEKVCHEATATEMEVKSAWIQAERKRAD